MKYLILLSILISSCANDSKNKINTNNFQSESNLKTIEVIELNAEITLNELLTLCSEESKTPILYFHADWCKPCQEFKKTLENQLLKKVFKNSILISIDVDSNPHKIVEQFSINKVPTFIKLDKKAKVIAEITSSEWNENTPVKIAFVMDKFINKTVYNTIYNE